MKGAEREKQSPGGRRTQTAEDGESRRARRVGRKTAWRVPRNLQNREKAVGYPAVAGMAGLALAIGPIVVAPVIIGALQGTVVVGSRHHQHHGGVLAVRWELVN